MDRDYQLGQAFSECIHRLRPDSQQKLLAAFVDFAGADQDILSAFRLLFGNPLCLSVFIEHRPVSLAQIASLTLIAEESLSPSLAKRAQSFLYGYCGIPTEKLPSQQSKASSSNDQRSASGMGTSRDVSLDYEYVSTSLEESTIFAEDDAGQSSSGVSSNPGISSSHSSDKRSIFTFKPIFYLVILMSVALGIFKLPAVCEPFGLCNQKDDSLNRDSKERRTPGDKNVPAPSRQQSSSPPALQRAPIAPPMPSTPTSPAARSSSPQPPYAPPARLPESAPLREEPLW